MVAEDAVAVPEGFEVLVVGSGVSGLCAAVNLQAAGIPFTILEKTSTVGGTWRDNRYPGAGVDTPNHLYSFSFATYDWSKYFALRDELYSYLDTSPMFSRCATTSGLTPRCSRPATRRTRSGGPWMSKPRTVLSRRCTAMS